MAEREGFEPPEPFGSVVFKTTAFGHSAISPGFPFDQFWSFGFIVQAIIFKFEKAFFVHVLCSEATGR